MNIHRKKMGCASETRAVIQSTTSVDKTLVFQSQESIFRCQGNPSRPLRGDCHKETNHHAANQFSTRSELDYTLEALLKEDL